MEKNSVEYRVVASLVGGIKSINVTGEDAMEIKVLEFMESKGFRKCIVENKVTKERSIYNG